MKILLPSKNLGCFGVRVSKRYAIYFDIYTSPHLGMFIRVWTHSWRITRGGISHKYIG